jgi:sortase A
MRIQMMYVKARLAHLLLDTSALVRMEFVRQKTTYFVLPGGSSRAWALGPAHVGGTAAPGEIGNCVLSAHRDAQFAVLHGIDIGDEIVVETPTGEVVRYRVRSIRVVNETNTAVLQDFGDRRLTLLSSYPFDASGDLRYAVVATAKDG